MFYFNIGTTALQTECR